MSEVRWCVCLTKGHQEKLALENVQRQGFEAYLPLRLVELRPRGQPPRTVALPFFPRYLFVRIDLSVNGWRKLYSTMGVQSVLGSAERPAAVVEKLVADIRAREVGGLVKLAPGKVEAPWEKGEPVTYGGYLNAIFHEQVDARRCRILVSLFSGVESLQTVDTGDIESRRER